MSSSARGTVQLGMPYGTACQRLRKYILFMLVQESGRTKCFKCAQEILSADDLSIEHKKPWLDVSSDLFWDLGNISFSHRRCNRPHRQFVPPPPSPCKHGSERMYSFYGCRCLECKQAKSIKNSKRIRASKA